MNQIIPKLRRFCYRFSGEDRFIIRKCNKRIQEYFALIGLCVLFVFVACWLSAALFMSHVFDGARWASIPVGIFWALLVTNLYFFLLYTISPALLPVPEKGKNGSYGKGKSGAKMPRKRYLLFSFSFLTRTGFIAFLAVIIAQPFNILLFAPRYEDADKLAATIRQVLSTEPRAWINTVLFSCLLLLPVLLKYRIRKICRENFIKDFGQADADQDIRNLRAQLSHPTDHAQLFSQILSVDLNSIHTADFYFQKTLIEYRIILEEYQQFKEAYIHLLTDRINVANLKCDRVLEPYLNRLKQINPEQYRFFCDQIERYLWEEPVGKYEYWADPPFRTTNKPMDRELAAETELLQILYPHK